MNLPPAVFRFLLLTLLCTQNAAITLCMRYSRGVLHEQYLLSTTVLVNESLKLVISLAVLAVQYDFHLPHTFTRCYHILQPQHSLPLIVPGIIYLVQNQLTFVGLQHLESTTYAIFTQLKILTTAVFSYVLLQKQLSGTQWRALILLFIGVVMVQTNAEQQSSSRHSVDDSGVSQRSTLTGVLAVLAVSTLSGLAAVWFERVLKGRSKSNGSAAASAGASKTNGHTLPHSMPTHQRTLSFSGNSSKRPMSPSPSSQPALTLTDRNIQLAAWGVVLAFLSIIATPSDRQHILQDGFFAGYSFVTWIVIALSAGGGLIVSLVVQFADNILKGFSTTFAIILTSLVSWLYLNDLQPDVQFVCGCSVVIVAVLNYTLAGSPGAANPATMLSPSKEAQPTRSSPHCTTCNCMQHVDQALHTPPAQAGRLHDYVSHPKQSTDEVDDDISTRQSLLTTTPGSSSLEVSPYAANGTASVGKGQRGVELTKRTNSTSQPV